MAKSIRLTYKKTKRTGLSAVGAGFYVEVKHKKKKIGCISGGRYDGKPTCIQIAVKTAGGIGWEWKFLKHDIKSEADAKALVQSKIDQIAAEYELHYFED